MRTRPRHARRRASKTLLLSLRHVTVEARASQQRMAACCALHRAQAVPYRFHRYTTERHAERTPADTPMRHRRESKAASREPRVSYRCMLLYHTELYVHHRFRPAVPPLLALRIGPTRPRPGKSKLDLSPY